MSDHENLGKTVANAQFPAADYKLRRGVHISIEDVELYDFVKMHFGELSDFYRRYDADLMEGTEGYFYLISQGSIFGHRQLSKAEMLIGLSISHLYRDPENRIKGTGELTVEQVLSRLETLRSKEDIGKLMTESKVKADLHPQKVREATLDAIKKLAALNFIQLVETTGNAFRCKRPIHRFDQFVLQLDSATQTTSNGADVENF